MKLYNLLLNLEDIAYKSRILKATMFAVNEQLYEELGEENRAILDGISESIRDLDAQIQKWTAKGFAERTKKQI